MTPILSQKSPFLSLVACFFDMQFRYFLTHRYSKLCLYCRFCLPLWRYMEGQSWPWRGMGESSLISIFLPCYIRWRGVIKFTPCQTFPWENKKCVGAAMLNWMQWKWIACKLNPSSSILRFVALVTIQTEVWRLRHWVRHKNQFSWQNVSIGLVSRFAEIQMIIL